MTPHPIQEVGTQRVLVVEDDREVRYLLAAILRAPDREVVVVSTAREALEALDAGAFSLILLDLILPDSDGRTLLRVLRERPEAARVPVVVVSSRTSPDVRSECFGLGADAFVDKPFDPVDLARDVDARLERSARAERRERSDDLTGLFNRAGILDLLENQDADERLAVVALQLDGIEDLSERYGWGTAERIVYEVATVLRESLDEDAPMGRLSGGEFAVLLPGALAEQAPRVANELVARLRDLPIEGPDRETFRLTLSAGLAEGLDTDHSGESLLEQAQRRAFRAREAGGNRLVVGEAPTSGRPRPILIAEDDDITATILRHRLEKEGFEVIRYANGRDAHRGALAIEPSLVILDVKMPGMDGFELLERLRRTPAYARVPIVMVTSMGAESDVVRAFQLGADDFIHKPFSPSELVARLRRFLARSQSRAGP
ncbi:MAG: response regulator [Longimicrobiales bacterium]